MSGSADPTRHGTHAALSVASRTQLLDLLRGDDRPCTARELADSSGLHVNTVRFHLDVLVKAGLVAREHDHTGRRGRPRLVFSPAAAPSDDHYQLLASALAQHWAGTPAERAERAERAGYGVATVPDPDRPAATLREAIAEVAGVFDRMGFRPEVVPVGEEGGQIRLHHCPFGAVAAEHPDVVCSLHLGMIRRILDDANAPASTTRLEPFAEPELCIAHVTGVDRGHR